MKGIDHKEDENVKNGFHFQDISALEMKRIKESVERSDTDKFLLFARLMRIHFMLKNAVITHR